MKVSFTTTHGELTVALDAIAALSPTRPPVPILACLKITAHIDGTVTVDTFDYETHVRVALNAWNSDVSGEDAELVVNRALLTSYVRSLTAGSTKAKQAGLPVVFTVDGNNLQVTADGYEFTLPTFPVDEYPLLPVHRVGQFVTVDRDTMRGMVTRLLVSAGHDDTLPMLTGISIKGAPGGLEMATTDRFRLSLGFVPTVEPEADIKVLVPAKLLGTIFRYLPAGPVQCTFSDGQAVFLSGAVSISTRLMDNEFVKYQSLIPSKAVGDVVVSRGDLAVAVKRVATTVDRGHHLRFVFAGSELQVSAGGEDGRAKSPKLRTEQVGNDMAGPTAFNPEYIGEALASFASDAVSIRYDTPSRPVFIAEPGELDNPRAFRTLVMPARLPG